MKNLSKDAVWILLFVSLLASMLWFFIPAASNLYRYFSLSESVEASVSKWFIEETSLGEFHIGANYSFKLGEKTYHNETIFNSPKFRNPASADDEIKHKPNHFLAFYSPQNADFSSLQKEFPLKESVSALILLILIFYFAGLKIYTENKL